MSDALIVILRYVLSAGFTWLIAHGYLGQGAGDQLLDPTVTILLGTLGWLGTVSWALYRSRLKAKIKDVLAHAGIVRIHADPSLAAALKVPGVVPAPLPAVQG